MMRSCSSPWSNLSFMPLRTHLSLYLISLAHIFSHSNQIDAKVPWSFQCPLCGQDCVLEVPVIKLTHTLKMPDCPITPKKRSHSLTYHLWRASPTNGWISVPFVGDVQIFKEPDEVFAEFSVLATVRQTDSNSSKSVSVLQVMNVLSLVEPGTSKTPGVYHNSKLDNTNCTVLEFADPSTLARPHAIKHCAYRNLGRILLEIQGEWMLSASRHEVKH